VRVVRKARANLFTAVEYCKVTGAKSPLLFVFVTNSHCESFLRFFRRGVVRQSWQIDFAPPPMCRHRVTSVLGAGHCEVKRVSERCVLTRNASCISRPIVRSRSATLYVLSNITSVCRRSVDEPPTERAFREDGIS